MKKATIFIVLLVIIGVLMTPFLFILLVPMLIAGAISGDVDTDINGYSHVLCNQVQDIDYETWNEQFSKAGVLSSHADDFIYYAEQYNIDPVLLASIAFHETGWGTSNAVVNYNNPGGLMNPNTNWSTVQHFPTLIEGIEAMAKNLNRLINERGLVTIDQLGSVYAPVGAANDPTGLNINWVPTVTNIVNNFGGLTMNCEVMGQVEIIDDVAWVVPYTKNITSGFRPPHRPDHNGIDIASAGINGQPVVAMMDGTVIASTANGTTFPSSQSNMGVGYGWYVAIDHGNGIETRYAHLLEQGVPVGTEVKAGEVIGRVGTTGRSTGPHLHFEVLVNGQHVNPMIYLSQFIE